MERIKFTFSGGFPIKQKLFAKMQKSYYQIMEAFVGHLGLPDVGNFIINGCEVVGSNITPGKMYIDGDLCSFGGGVGDLTTKVKKIETVEDAPFKNGNNNPVYLNFEAKINIGGEELQNFIRVEKVQDLVNSLTDWDDILNVPNLVVDPFISNALTPTVIPQETLLQRLIKLEAKTAVFTAGGGMVLWNKPANQIPEHWQEVVDWKGRIPVGVDTTLNNLGELENPEFGSLIANQIVPGKTGGLKKITLDLENVPKHGFYAYRGTENQIPAGGSGANGNNQNLETDFAGGKLDGSTKAFPILPPYRTVLFIEYIG
jgi:hypothetical protein